MIFFSENPESIEAATELGLLYLKIGDVQRAFQQFGTAIAHSPNYAKAILPVAYIIQVNVLLYIFKYIDYDIISNVEFFLY